MNEPSVNVAQLRKRAPSAWTALLRHEPDLEDVLVAAVSERPLYPRYAPGRQLITRYYLSLAGHSDPISFIGKHTSRQEALFYRHLAPQIPQLAPKCWYTHTFNNDGWIVLDDVPNHTRAEQWTAPDMNDIVGDLVSLHAHFWQQDDMLQSYDLTHFLDGKRYTWDDLRREHAFFFESGPGAAISEHAIYHVGRLAPVFLQAANGLTVMRDLGGWPGIMGESHLTAVGDLLDDPVPMLEALRDLPDTLLHGDPHTYHWRLTLFNQRRLIDWDNVTLGPGICDLISFLEQFDLLYRDGNLRHVQVREEWPATEETITDTYMLEMSATLPNFDARAARLALPAARCLYVLTNWFPYFATWAEDMPHKYEWQKINRMSDEQLANTEYQPIIRFRPYLRDVFRRFLRAYRTL